MKAHIPVDRRTVRENERLTKIHVEEERHCMTRRVFKVLVYVLHNEFGFGVKRINRVVKGMESLMKEDNPIFWEQLDRHVIDYLGIPFEREQVDLDGNLTFDESQSILNIKERG